VSILLTNFVFDDAGKMPAILCFFKQGGISARETYISRLKAFEVSCVLFFYKDDKPKGFKLLNNIRKQAKLYLVCQI
jgi:hypothetical protein